MELWEETAMHYSFYLMNSLPLRKKLVVVFVLVRIWVMTWQLLVFFQMILLEPLELVAFASLQLPCTLVLESLHHLLLLQAWEEVQYLLLLLLNCTWTTVVDQNCYPY